MGIRGLERLARDPNACLGQEWRQPGFRTMPTPDAPLPLRPPSLWRQSHIGTDRVISRACHRAISRGHHFHRAVFAQFFLHRRAISRGRHRVISRATSVSADHRVVTHVPSQRGSFSGCSFQTVWRSHYRHPQSRIGSCQWTQGQGRCGCCPRSCYHACPPLCATIGISPGLNPTTPPVANLGAPAHSAGENLRPSM
jgi:hypothetical protein